MSAIVITVAQHAAYCPECRWHGSVYYEGEMAASAEAERHNRDVHGSTHGAKR